ncbi:MAG: prepilin-type N-terminal cleavage/methylation domain-containing protein, partial [Verrucomicrobiales bacterium]|nr:prepilin-type N-terminal cleavage/methylation domain-containing protein [Verrucomicrobiales bacterium]
MDRYWQKIPGFTLVELMVAVAVIAVVLVIGVPGIAN